MTRQMIAKTYACELVHEAVFEVETFLLAITFS
jgi:hypothetical protein